jgi:Bacterial Ig-like domain
MRLLVLLPVALLAAAAEVRAADLPSPTSGNESLQRALYGAPREATVEQLLAAPADYEGRAVMLRGRFTRGRTRDEFRIGTDPQALRVEPSTAIAARVRARAPGWSGQEVEVVGVLLRERRDDTDARRYVLRFWQYHAQSPPPRETLDAPVMSLEDLVYSGGKADGRTVRVVGQFRGSNLHGDLPPVSRQGETDWVIKDAFYAVWITGHGADGDGFQLDAQALEDQENWVEVVGRPDTKDGITYLKAQRVALTDAPQGVSARSTPARNALAAIPPAVVFTLPVNGEEGAPADVRPVVQFNKSMDERSFTGRVRLRMADAPGDAEDVRLAYDEAKHALVVEPARPLPAGRELVLELMDGIIDVHGLALTKGRVTTEGAVEAVRFRIGG